MMNYDAKCNRAIIDSKRRRSIVKIVIEKKMSVNDEINVPKPTQTQRTK